MAWELTEDVEAFAAVAGDFLGSRPVEHTVFLTLIGTLRRRGLHTYGPGDPIFGWWRGPDAAVAGVLLQTPPHPLLVSGALAEAGPAAAAALAGRPLPGANLPVEAAPAFADEWQRRTGRKTSTARRTRLHRLGTLIPPPVPAPGSARVAGEDDREVVLRWMTAFVEEIDEPATDVNVLADDRFRYGGITLWESGGEPVSMAIRSRLEAGMVRLQNVYTPPAERGKGYAAAATVASTRAALAAGADTVVLVTDLANPISNRLYQRLGYQPIEDRVVVEFS